MLVLDGVSGQFHGNFSVTLEGDELVFVFDGSEEVRRHELEGSTIFLDLANLVKPGAGLEFERVPLPPELAYGVMPVCDREYEEPAAAEVLALAEQLGPLFGWGDADPMGNVAREPVAAWIATAKVLNFAVRAHAYTGSLERIDDANMEGDVAYSEIDGWPSTYYPNGGVVSHGAKGFGNAIPEPYASMLRLSDNERRELMNPVMYGGGAAVYGEWCCEDGYFAVAATVDAPWYPWEEKRSAVVRGRDIDARWGAPTEDSFSCQQMIADEMFQILVRVHLNNVRLGWGVMRDAKTDRDLGTLCPFFTCLLQRIWYVLGLHHSGGKLGVCKRCGKLFSADNERKSTKIYCSKACQEAAKDQRTKARRKRQRAEAKKAKAVE